MPVLDAVIQDDQQQEKIGRLDDHVQIQPDEGVGCQAKWDMRRQPQGAGDENGARSQDDNRTDGPVSTQKGAQKSAAEGGQDQDGRKACSDVHGERPFADQITSDAGDAPCRRLWVQRFRVHLRARAMPPQQRPT